VQETAHALLDQETLSGVALEATLATVVAVDLADLPGAEPRSDSDSGETRLQRD
jgi:hypothetical protein